MTRFCLGEQIVSELSNRVTGKKGNNISGFSLLEVLIASSIFSMGLAGVAALLLTSISQSAEARREGLAAMAAASLAEQIRLNPVALNQYLNPTDTISITCLGMEHCFPCHDATPMDGEAGDDHCDGAGPLVIKIFWAGPGGDQQSRQHRYALVVS
jgi:prepilin-type N-terminal cleavage/methylation domain-containing protein